MKKSRSRSRSKSRSRKAGRKVTIKVETKRSFSKRGRGRGRGRSGLVVIGRRSAPVAKAASFRQRGPRINGGKVFNVKHREMVHEVNNTVTNSWVTYRYQLQPGLTSVFPWLGQIAVNYKEYRFRSIRFEYEPNCATSRTGAVIGVPLYDPNQSTPESAPVALDCKNAMNVPVWQRLSTNFRGQKTQKTLLIRSGPLSVPTESPLYDSGAFVLALDHLPDAGVAGKLFVSYDVDFFVPTRGNGNVGGYGVLLSVADNANTNLQDSPYAGLDVATVPGPPEQDCLWMPDLPAQPENQWITVGGSSWTPIDVNNGTITFYQPGVYHIVYFCQHTSTNNTIVSAVNVTGGTEVTVASSASTVTANVTERVVSSQFFVQQPYGTLAYQWSSNSPVRHYGLDIATLPNQMFAASASVLGSSIPSVTTESSMRAVLLRYPGFGYYAKDNVVVLSDEHYKLYRGGGDLKSFPKRNVTPMSRQVAGIEDSIWQRLFALGVIDDKFRDKALKKAEIPSDFGGDRRPPHEPPSFDRKSSVTVLEEGSDDDFKIDRADSPVPLKEPPLQVAPVAAAAVPVSALVVQGDKRKAPKQG